MKNPSVAKMVKMAGNNRTAMKMKAEEAAAMKMKKAAMKLKEEAAMKKAHEAAMKLKKESAMKAAKPDFPDIDGDGNTSESMKQAAADKKSATKMKKSATKKLGKNAKVGDADKKQVGKRLKNNPPSEYASKGAQITYKNTKKGPQRIFGGPGKQAKSNFQPMEKIEELPKMEIKQRPKRDPLPKAAMKLKKASAAKLKKESPAKMGHSPKKMKKSAMKLSEADKKKAIDNAMPAAKKEVLSSSTVAGMKKYFGGVNADFDKVRTELRKAKNMGNKNVQEMRKIAKARYPKLMRNY